MNEKLMARIARKYKGWMVRKAKSSPSVGNFSYRTDNVVDQAQQIKQWSKIFLSGMQPRIQLSSYPPYERYEGIWNKDVYRSIGTHMIPDLITDIIAELQFISHMTKHVANPGATPIFSLSIEEIIDEIKIVESAWSNVEYKRGMLSVLIENVVLTEDDNQVDLGDFRIELEMSDPMNGLSINSVDSNESACGYCHPHVSRGTLCTGDGGAAMKDALCQGRLEDYFRIVEAILRTYNPSSPHEALTEWYDPQHEGMIFCEHCEEWGEEDYSYYCEGCDTSRCEGCSEGGCCTSCGEYRCGECSSVCEECNDTICGSCSQMCHECSHNVCRDCSDDCERCGDTFCDSCTESCGCCGDKTCDDCKMICECCGDEHCATCTSTECNECHKDICNACITTCNECQESICEKCDDNECKDCGGQMCKSCLKQHSCLLQEANNAK